MTRTALVAVLSIVSGLLASAPLAWAQTIGLEPPTDLAGPPPEADRAPSGLVSRVIVPGEGGPAALPDDYVTVHFAGWTTDGNIIDSSGDAPPMFPLNRTLPGFRECVQLMAMREHRRCWVPATLGYRGQEGRPDGPVVFDVVLLEARRPPREAPEDVAEPPEDAIVTESGLAYRRLRTGTGVRNPTEFSQVQVHYTGWSTEGVMFDTSLNDGAPRTFQANGVIAGWTEGLQLMVEGERMRFWIPENLAYEGEESFEPGMLVFDVELVRILN